MKNWNQLQYVFAVAKNGTYGSAARELGTSPITVSRNIQSLTEEFGVSLFTLKDGSWKPTKAGRELSDLGAEVRSRIASIEVAGALAELIDQPLRINSVSFINAHFLSNAIDVFGKKYPNIRLELNASDESVDLERGDADVCLRLFEPTSGNLTRLKISTFPVKLYHFSGATPTEWVGLSQELDWLPEMAMAHEEFAKPPALRVDSYSAMVNAVENSKFGCALPSCIARKVPNLVEMNSNHKPGAVTRTIWMVYRSERRSDVTIRAAKNWLRGMFQSPNSCLCGACI